MYCTFKCTEDTKWINYLKIKYSSFGQFRLRMCNFEKSVKSVLLLRDITMKENGGKNLLSRVSILVDLVPELYF
jgi:hypothetical protein